jgi:hypothetical protein
MNSFRIASIVGVNLYANAFALAQQDLPEGVTCEISGAHVRIGATSSLTTDSLLGKEVTGTVSGIKCRKGGQTKNIPLIDKTITNDNIYTKDFGILSVLTKVLAARGTISLSVDGIEYFDKFLAYMETDRNGQLIEVPK